MIWFYIAFDKSKGNYAKLILLYNDDFGLLLHNYSLFQPFQSNLFIFLLALPYFLHFMLSSTHVYNCISMVAKARGNGADFC